MKHLLIFLGLICFLAKTSFAYPPMEELPLKERVGLASHIFVGVVERAIVVDDDYREITDDRLMPELSNFVLLQVRVEESLISPKWHPTKPVIAGYGGIWVRLKETRKEMIGQRAIFITNMDHLQHWGPIFVPTDGYFLTEPVEKKAEIQKLLKISPQDNESWSQSDQMAQYIRDSESITKGTPREEVEKLLKNVGRTSETKDKYAFKRSPYVMLDIEFARINGRDTVVSVSKPYLDWPK